MCNSDCLRQAQQLLISQLSVMVMGSDQCTDAVAVAFTKGPIMAPRSRDAMTTQTLRRSEEPLRLCVGLRFLWSGPGGGRKEGPQGRKGSVTLVCCGNVEQ